LDAFSRSGADPLAQTQQVTGTGHPEAAHLTAARYRRRQTVRQRSPQDLARRPLSAPDNDVLYVSSTTPRRSGIDILVAYLRPRRMSTRTSPRSAAALPLTPAPTTQTCAGDSKSRESRAWRSVECTQYYTETQRNRRSSRLPEATPRVKYEDFSALGGSTPTHSRTDDA
jgi:hypothetical protein